MTFKLTENVDYLDITVMLVMIVVFCFSALVKLLNKSIEGTADDDEEGVTPDTAIRSGLELLKVKITINETNGKKIP